MNNFSKRILKFLCIVFSCFLFVQVSVFAAKGIIGKRTGTIKVMLPNGKFSIYRKSEPVPANLRGATIVVLSGTMEVAIKDKKTKIKVLVRDFEAWFGPGDVGSAGVDAAKKVVFSISRGEIKVMHEDYTAIVESDEKVQFSKSKKGDDSQVISIKGNIRTEVKGINIVVKNESVVTISGEGEVSVNKGEVTVIDRNGNVLRLRKGDTFSAGEDTETEESDDETPAGD